MKKLVPYIAASLALLCASVAVAQDVPTPPPNYIQIYREEVKPGKVSAHAKTEAAFVRDFKAAKASPNYTALVSVTGPDEAWFIARYESYAAYGNDMKAVDSNATLKAELDRDSAADGELLSAERSIVARYRADLSYRPGVSIPLTRFFSISIIRVRPGHTAEFEENRKIIKTAHEKLTLHYNYSVYQVTSGMPAGTFIVLTYYKSMADIDAAQVMHGKDYDDAVGESGMKKLNDNQSTAILGTDTMLMAVDPKMSYPAKEWIDADPAFWAPKPAAPAKPAAPKTPGQ
jgi:quinol monooxygenase YgiN